MNKIIFFHHGHNGDMMHCQEFIRDIALQLPHFQFSYYHPNNPITSAELADLVHYDGPPSRNEMPRYERFIEKGNTLYVNCFVAAYGKLAKIKDSLAHHYYYEGGTNYVMLHNMWSYIYYRINKFFNTSITIAEEKEYYFPKINYQKFANILLVDNFIKNNPNKNRILISNGRVNSKQSFQDNMTEIISALASLNPDTDFIVTSPLKKVPKNVINTAEIIPIVQNQEFYNMLARYNLPRRCDLIEISYLSTFCSVIVGKNSGPFVFTMTKENLMNSQKTFISFDEGSHYDSFVDKNTGIDSLVWGSKIKANYIWSNDFSTPNIFQTIQNELTK
jgi:hypothetical protein